MIKYKYQYNELALPIIKLLDVSAKKNITVVLNAVGVEGYDPNSIRCSKIKNSLTEAVHRGTLKYISTRDDLETLLNYIPRNSWSICKKVADPAVWISEAFDVKKHGLETIGVGVIREQIFVDNGQNFSSLQLYKLYIQTILMLKERGFQSIELFTNGQFADNLFAKRLYDDLTSKGISVSLKIPDDPRGLVDMIASYEGVLTARLHSCVIAYSLEVPFIGIVWNEKLKFFGKSVGMEENFIGLDYLKPELLVQRFENALRIGFQKDDKYCETIKKYIYMIGLNELL